MELYHVYTGLEFNKINHNNIFIKITNNNQNHKGFQYKIGLNIDTLPFNPTGTCNKGGLYFIEFKYAIFYRYYGDFISHAMIPNDALVYIEQNKYKTNKLILLNRYKFTDHPFWLYKKLCLESVKLNGFALQYVKIQTPEICLESVKHCGLMLKYVQDQSDEICLAAIVECPHALKYVKNKTILICTIAIKQNGCMIKYVPNPNIELKRLSNEKYEQAIEFIKKRLKNYIKNKEIIKF